MNRFPSQRLWPLLPLISLLLGACEEVPEPAQAASLTVATLAVQLQDGYEQEQEYTGSVLAAQHDDIGFELGGTISRVLVDEGDAVQREQPLAELDTRLLQSERAQLQAQIAETVARVTLIDANLRRETSLKRSGFAAEQRLDELRAERAALEATRARLDAALEASAVRLEKSVLRAPYAGVVSRRYRDTGAVTAPGAAVLRLIDSAQREARVGVPAPLAAQLASGTRVTVRIDDALHQAVVITRAVDIDPLTRTVAVRLALPDLPELVEGHLLGLRLREQISARGAWLPQTALAEGLRGLWLVYVAVAEPGGGARIETRDVDVLHGADGRVFVSGALAGGELVVASGTQRLSPGQLVRITAAR